MELTAPAPVVLRARQLALGYGRSTHGRRLAGDEAAMLRGLDLDVTAGESVAVVGPNGCGKTTLLRALAGLLAPLGGALTYPSGGTPGTLCGARGMLLLQDEPVAPFSVRELVTLGLGRDGPPSESERGQVARTLAELGLDALADRRCDRISGGEWQRARLARALVARPSLLRFDEPTNHLDPAGRARLLDLCARARRRAAPAFALVLATHDLDLAARCDRVLVLARGTSLGFGRPAALLTPARLTRAFGVAIHRFRAPGQPVPLFRAEVLA